MYPFIICSCGRAIGELYELFVQIKLNELKNVTETTDINASTLYVNEEAYIDMSKVWQYIGISLECCKSKISFQQKMSDYY